LTDLFAMTRAETSTLAALAFPVEPAAERSRIELVVAGNRHPVCAPNRVMLDSGSLWSGYRLELVRVPASGLLEQVSSPYHRVVFVVGGTCTVRFRAYLHEGRQRLSPGTFCFIGRGYLFERLAWKGRSFEAIIVDIADFGADPNPIDAFGRTDALFDMYMGIEDARAATLIDLMRSEIEAGCPTGGAYGEALSLALGSRVASLCATIPGEQRRAAMLSSKQLQRVADFVRSNLAHELTIERLAALVNMSPFHFARCFKQTTGFTPHQFVIRERIARARSMLASGKQSIGDVAMALGFASQSHFADVYRRITGTSPRRDRSGV
jgi:AraC family transcriptional regulator